MEMFWMTQRHLLMLGVQSLSMIMRKNLVLVEMSQMVMGGIKLKMCVMNMHKNKINIVSSESFKSIMFKNRQTSSTYQFRSRL